MQNYSKQRLTNEANLVKDWKAYSSIIKNRKYPNVGNKDWGVAKQEILSKGDVSEIKMLNAIEDQFTIQPLTNSKPVMAVAYCEDLEGLGGNSLFVEYNLTTTEKAVFDYQALDPVIKEYIQYLTMIRNDMLSGGKVFESLYKDVTLLKLTSAGDVASHAEVLAMDKIIKQMRSKGIFTSRTDLGKIKILVRGKNDWGNMCRCPHCFQLTDGVKMIGNQ